MKLVKLLLLILIILFLAASCDRQPTKVKKDFEKVDIEDLKISDNFHYRTSEDVSVKLSAFTNSYEPVKGINFDVYTDYGENNERKIISCSTDKHGIASVKVRVPTSVTDMTVVGFMSKAKIPIINNQVAFQFGGSGTPDSPLAKELPYQLLFKPGESSAVTFTYLDSYSTGSSGGVPNTMTFDAISASYLQRIDSALPEQDPVPSAHPEYLASGNEIDIVLLQEADVWVTFVHEGAGNKNALGFYTYDNATGPPATPDDLDYHKIIFPNVSLTGSGGGLVAGDKVLLGRFSAGTAIGWFLCANAWTGTSVSTFNERFYSNPDWNPESTAQMRQHNVLLFDAVEQKMTLSFEDLNRDGSSDEDFNDAVFYVSSNPPEAIDTTNVQTTLEKAEDPFYFISSTTGTLSFEDRWPQTADYDFNDLVVDYNFTEYLNGSSEITQIDGEITLRAIGATYHNGFGIEFPFADSDIQTFNNNGNATITRETGGRAIIFLFNDSFDIIPEPASPSDFVNTKTGVSYTEPVTLTFSMTLATPLAQSSLEYTDPTKYDPDLPVTPPYNPFIIVNGTRSHEVHLPDHPVTALMNTDLYGQGNDSTAPIIWRYFKTNDNLPWAIHTPTQWDYPIERSPITAGFLDFAPWGQSNGVSSTNWYDRQTADVDLEHIYINN